MGDRSPVTVAGAATASHHVPLTLHAPCLCESRFRGQRVMATTVANCGWLGMKIDRIYTRGGDYGQTSLGDGTRVEKHALRVRVMGDVDEANAAIGVAIAATPGAEWSSLLLRVQNDLFDLGADLCVPHRAGAE